MQTIVIASGGFDPLHSGHIRYLQNAKSQGNKLVVLLNSDEWLTRKKGRPFMPFEERATILEKMEMVDYVYGVDDSDGSVKQGIKNVMKAFENSYTGKEKNKFIFCNGGDRTKDHFHGHVLIADEQDSTIIHEADLQTPHLINVGQLHSSHNPTSEKRFVVTLALFDLYNQRLLWKDAMKKFEKYYDN